MIDVRVVGSRIEIETDHYDVAIQTEGYVSGTERGSFRDKKTGATDLGFGCSIADFLLEPADGPNTEPNQYQIDPVLPVHGSIPKRYVEGPQICTKARKLPYEIVRGRGFVAVKQWFRFHEAYTPYEAGSRWEQTLVFPEDRRYYFSADRITSVNDHPALIFRIDMPGHVRHQAGDTFSEVYLSYEGPIPAPEFSNAFPPDGKFLYRRPKPGMIPERMIRSYRVRLDGVDGEPGPYFGGITLEPADVYQAWCHERGYICMIEEIGGRPVRAGQTFGACYCVGWFDHVEEMEAVADAHAGWSGLELVGKADRPRAYDGLTQTELPPVREIART